VRHRQLPGIAGLITVSLLLAAPFSMPQESGLSQRVTTLETQVAGLTAQLAALTQSLTIDVNCAGGDSIQATLNSPSVQNHPALVLINVFGVCSENLVVTRRVVIRAGAPGAGITAANHSQNVVRSSNPGLGSTFLGLIGLTISGGSAGVLVDFATQVQLSNCVVSNNGTGIVVSHQGLVRLGETVVENNAADGVSATNGAQVVVGGGAVRNNGRDGLSLNAGAAAALDGSAEIASNARYGISLAAGSWLALNAATITGSALTGIFVGGASTVALQKGATITANTSSGISLMDTSLVTKHRGEADIHITNNGGYGVVCSGQPAVAQIVGFTFETGDISGNASGNINCPISPGPFSQ